MWGVNFNETSAPHLSISDSQAASVFPPMSSPGGMGSSCPFSSFPGPFGLWRLVRGQMKGTHRAGGKALLLLFSSCASHLLTRLACCGQRVSTQLSEGPSAPPEATPASALTLLLSRLFCVLALVLVSQLLPLSVSVSVSVPVCVSPPCCYWLQLTLRSSKTYLGLHQWDSWTAAPPCLMGTGASPVQPHPSLSPAWRTAAVGPAGAYGQGDVSSGPSGPVDLGWSC